MSTALTSTVVVAMMWHSYLNHDRHVEQCPYGYETGSCSGCPPHEDANHIHSDDECSVTCEVVCKKPPKEQNLERTDKS